MGQRETRIEAFGYSQEQAISSLNALLQFRFKKSLFLTKDGEMMFKVCVDDYETFYPVKFERKKNRSVTETKTTYIYRAYVLVSYAP